MKKYLLLILCLVSSLMASAESGTCGANLTWSLEDGILVISGTGAMTNYSSESNAPWYSSRSTVSLAIISEGVTSIGNYAFYNCSGLTSITIPNSVTSIGDYAFWNCSGLTSITIPNSVTSIGFFAFNGCSGLTSVNITDLASWCNIDFGSLGANPTYYAHKLVLNGTEIKDLVIPEGVTEVKNKAFSGCSGLTSINIPNSVTSIGQLAFANCSGLTSINIPNSVTSIGERTFDGCSGLTSITIPNSVTSIGDYAFTGCSGLTSVTIPNSVTSIGSSAFWNCSGLTSITIPDGVTSIGSSAFQSCYGLTSVKVLAATPPTCGSDLLMYAGTSTIHVYEGLADTYKAASGWSSYNFVDDIPTVRVTNLTLDATIYLCGIGQRFTPLVVTYEPEDATIKQVTWSSSDPSVLTIVPSTGGCIGLKDGIVTITATAKDAGHATVTATVYVGNVSPEDAVTISASSDDTEHGTVSGGGVFLPNTTVTLTATPALGYVFDHWSDGSTENPYILEANEDKALVAYFRSTWTTITASSANEAMGTVTGAGNFPSGATVFLKAIPEVGYEFAQWSDGSKENPYVFTASEDKNIVATFIPWDNPQIQSKTKATTLKPNQWYVITQARLGESPAYEDVANSRVMRAATSVDVHVGDYFDDVKNFLVRFLPTEYEGIYKIQWGTDHYWFTTNSLSSGTIVKTTADEANAGNYFVYNINGEDGHFGMNLTTDGSKYGMIVDNNGATYTVSLWQTGKVTTLNGNNDWTFYEVEFPFATEVEISASCNTEHGTVTGSGIYERDTEVTLTAIPADGYKFIRWSDGTTDNPYTFLATIDKTLTAEFQLVDMILADGTAYAISAEGTYDHISYTRTFNNTEWQALYVPFRMSYEDWCDEFEVAKINNFHQYDRDDDGTPDELELEVFKVKSGTLKQNHPYLIKALSTGEKTITLTDATLYAAEENSFVCNSMETQYTFTGTYAGMSGADMYNNNYYSMGGGALINAEDDTADLKPYRWFLQMTDREGQVIPAPSRIRVMVWDGQATGMESLSQDNNPTRAIGIDGRSVKSMKARGLYIVNGKKVLR